LKYYDLISGSLFSLCQLLCLESKAMMAVHREIQT